MASNGTVTQVIGSTFDAQFPENALPEIYNAVEIDFTVRGEKQTLVGEVAIHLGGGQVRCVALGATERIRRQHHAPELPMSPQQVATFRPQTG